MPAGKDVYALIHRQACTQKPVCLKSFIGLFFIYGSELTAITPIQNFLLGSRKYEETDDSDPVFQLLKLERKNNSKVSHEKEKRNQNNI